MPVEMIADLVLLGRRRGEIGLCHAKCVELVQGFESTEQLPRLNAVAHGYRPLDHASGDSEPERRLVQRLDAPGQYNRDTGLTLLESHGSDRPRLRLCDLHLLFA